MVLNKKSQVLIKSSAPHLRETVENIMQILAPASFNGASVLIKPTIIPAMMSAMISISCNSIR